jgi:hypothetical protein
MTNLELLTEMGPLLLKAKIGKRLLRKALKEAESEEPTEWFRTLHRTLYAAARRVRGCIAEHMWDYYEMLGIEGLQEQELWIEVCDDLRQLFRERYNDPGTKQVPQ